MSMQNNTDINLNLHRKLLLSDMVQNGFGARNRLILAAAW